MSDLLASLGLEFVNPTSINTGLKQLKPSEEPQIFSVILNTPSLPNTMIKYDRHNFYNQIKRNIRCSGGACCAKARVLEDYLAKLPEGDQRKRQKPKKQTRYVLPVVVYQGKSASTYGGPIEVRYIDISWSTYKDWDTARAAVNEEVCPFYQRDFIMTQDTSIKGVPVITHTENRAKWTVDPAIQQEVLNIVTDPKFVENYVKVIPPIIEESEFLAMWDSAMNQATMAEQALAAAAAIQPAISQPQINMQPQIMAQPQVMPQMLQQPVNTTPVEPVQAVQPVNPTPIAESVAPAEIPVNMGIPMTQTPVTPIADVPYTPQNIINGTYTTATLTNTVAPETIVNMQPVSLAPAEALSHVTNPAPQPVNVQPAQAAPALAQSEISLADIGDLDSIINSLPQV